MAQPTGPRRVPIVFEGQIVQGVEGEVEFDDGSNGWGITGWALTLDHILHLNSQIEQAIRNQFHIPSSLRIRVKPNQSHYAQFIEYESYDLAELIRTEETALAIPRVHNYPRTLYPSFSNPPFFSFSPSVSRIPQATLSTSFSSDPYAGIPVGPSRHVPNSARNAISYKSFKNDDLLVNFHEEASEYDRYYSKKTFDRLQLKGNPPLKENPFTRQPIQVSNVQIYKKSTPRRLLNRLRKESKKVGTQTDRTRMTRSSRMKGKTRTMRFKPTVELVEV